MKFFTFSIAAMLIANAVATPAFGQTPGGPGDLSPHIDIGVDADTGQLVFGFTGNLGPDTPIVIDNFSTTLPDGTGGFNASGFTNVPFTADQDVAPRTASDDIAAGFGFSSFSQFGQPSPQIALEAVELDPDGFFQLFRFPNVVDAAGESLTLAPAGGFIDFHPFYLLTTNDPDYIGRVEGTFKFVPQTDTGTYSASDPFDLILVVGGDYDDDSRLTATDIDSLSDAVRNSDTGAAFDLNRDGVVDGDDRTVWVETLSDTRFGDTNLDGRVDSTDVSILSGGFGTGQGWAAGDSSGDRQVDSTDVSILSGTFGFDASEPEPVPTPLTVTEGFAALTASTSPGAATISGTSTEESVAIRTGTTGEGDTYVAFDLLVGELAGLFDTIDVSISLETGTLLSDGDTEASLLSEGDDESSFNAFLTAPGVFGGLALSEFGYTETDMLLQATYASLGNNDASNSDLFIGQIVLQQDFLATLGTIDILLKDDGVTVGTINQTFGVPEPTSLALLAMAGAGLLFRRGRAAAG